VRADLLFRISIIDAGLELQRHLQSYPNTPLEDAVRQLRAGAVIYSSLDYENALALVDQHGFALFSRSPDRVVELRTTLFRMAVQLKPFWAKVSPLGRDRVRAVLSADQAQCLRYARLLGEVDESVRKWWDELASRFRSAQDKRLLDIGREGERLSFRLETETLRKLGITEGPYRISIEDNLAGYDILSYRPSETGAPSKLYIEVKTTVRSEQEFFLSRREWETAAAAGQNFIFHFWLLPDQQLWIATVDDVALNIPEDRGCGTWEKVRLGFKDKPFARVRFQDRRRGKTTISE